MLERIAFDRTIVVAPLIEAIEARTFENTPASDTARGGFTWTMSFIWDESVWRLLS
jgi:hypothetical protein